MRNVNVSRVYVRADLAASDGIRSWGDLKGKTFGPGVPGTRDMTRAIAANQLLGSGIEMVPGSLDDTASKLKDGSFAGMLKGSPHDRFDTAMLAVSTRRAAGRRLHQGRGQEAASAEDPTNIHHHQGGRHPRTA